MRQVVAPRMMVSPVRDFEDHFFVEFADARAFCGAGKKNSVEAAIGDGAAVDDGDAARALARREAIRDAIPGDARAQLGEFVAGVAAGEHVEHDSKTERVRSA